MAKEQLCWTCQKAGGIVRGAVAFSLWRVGLLKGYTARRMIRIE